MTDRAPLRAEFDSIANQRKSEVNFADRTKQLEALELTIIQGFNHIVKFLDGKTTKTEIINQLKEIGTPDVLKVVSALEKVNKTIVTKDIDLKPVLEALKGLQAEIATIEKKSPEFKQRESVKVENLDEIKLDTSKVVEAIKALKLKVDAPVINTEKTDLKPLQDIMLDLLKAFNKQKLFKDGDSVKVNNLKDIPLADLSKVEKKLDDSNKHLKVIAEKKFGGGSGGSESTLQFPLYSPTTTTINTVGLVTTIVKTNNVITKTTTVDKTSGTVVSVAWS